MAIYQIPLKASPSQRFSVQLGKQSFNIFIQWMVRFEVFRVDISLSDGTVITNGRILNPGVNLLAQTFPLRNLGKLYLEGDQPTPLNLGIDNELRWSDE